MRKNIVIAPCGNKGLVYKEHWLKDNNERDFDLCLLFYHPEIEHPERYADAEYFFHLQDFKFRMLHRLFTEVKPELLQQYEYFYFIDDDVVMTTSAINQMFAIARAHRLWICQASLTHDSYCSWPILKTNTGCFLRFLGQVEVMAPLFDQATLQKCLHTFTLNKSSWGIDAVWSKVLDYPTDKIAVVDAVQMTHIHPVGGGELYTKINEDHQQSWTEITQDAGAAKSAFFEHGRYLVVNDKQNKITRSFNRLNGTMASLKQTYLNYGLSYRIKSRLGIKEK